ncbi:MAG: hypothetical protein IJW86_06645 [Clostridia bacterium]|nr:hypothetical protein [Clostridia bacterium]
MKTNTKKLLSILLALMMMLSVVPFYASAAEPEALKAANVTQWPTITYKNGGDSINYGETVGDTIIINDDEIVLDAAGNQVAGHFEHQKADRIPDVNDAAKANLTFVPDDTTAYKGFNKLFSSDVTFKVNIVTPVPVDSNDTIPVATEIEAGADLSTSLLSGAKYTNPYNANEPRILASTWNWTTSGPVNESGYYKAVLNLPIKNYTQTFKWVLVRIKGDTSEVKMVSDISELPSITNEKISVGGSYADLELAGGKVVNLDGEELSGTFKLDLGADNTIYSAGTHHLNVIFTPDDSRYATATGTITITVEKGNFAFLDENGAETVPEITVPYGATMGDVQSALKGLAMNTTENIYFSFADGVKNTDYAATGTYNVIVRSYEDNSNYNETTLPVKVTVEQKELTLYGAYSAETKVLVFSTKEGIAPRGTFDVYVDGALVKSGVAYGEKVAYDAFTSSGVHTIKIVYIPKENDGYKIADFEIETQINLARNITAGENTGSITTKINGQNGHIGGDSLIVCGDTIELSTLGGEAFLGWKIADTNGNTVDLGIDLTATEISFTMPDYDIVVTAEYEKQADNNSGSGFDIDSIFGGLDLDELTQGDSEWVIINIIRNLIAKFKSFLQQLIETFQSIGD